jgi:hypothetical protein
MGIERVIVAPVEIRSCRKRRPVGYRWKLGLVLGIAGVRMTKFAAVVGVRVRLVMEQFWSVSTRSAR